MSWCITVCPGLRVAPDMAESKVVIAVDNSLVSANVLIVSRCNMITLHPLDDCVLSLHACLQDCIKAVEFALKHFPLG